MNTRQVYCAVCGIRMTDSLSLETSEQHTNVGSFPSTPNCSLGRTENRAVLGQHGRAWTLVQPRLLRFVFDFVPAWPRSEQTSSSDQTVNDGWLRASPSLSSTLFLKGMISAISPSFVPLFNHSSSTSPVFPLISCSCVGLG